MEEGIVLDMAIEGKREGMAIRNRGKIYRIEEWKQDIIEEGIAVGYLMDNKIK